MIKLTYYTDPGHGWFAVKRDLLTKLGLLFSISTYSYQKGQTVYLEEDCDASLLFARAKSMGIELKYTQKHTDKRSPIRGYEPFHPVIPTYYGA